VHGIAPGVPQMARSIQDAGFYPGPTTALSNQTAEISLFLPIPSLLSQSLLSEPQSQEAKAKLFPRAWFSLT
jgi:hypothetical protein